MYLLDDGTSPSRGRRGRRRPALVPRLQDHERSDLLVRGDL